MFHGERKETRPNVTAIKPGPDISLYSIFMMNAVEIHSDLKTDLESDLIYKKLIAIYSSLDSTNNFWCNVFEEWVRANTPISVDKPTECAAVLIHLAFHQKDEYTQDDNVYAEFSKDEVINAEWAFAKDNLNTKVQLSKASGGLLNKAAELLLSLKFMNGSDANDHIIKSLLLFTAGSSYSAGASRPYAYFLLGEMALYNNQMNYQKRISTAFDYFVFYLKLLPNKSKLEYRSDTIALHTAAWNLRHPNDAHPLMDMLENFDNELLDPIAWRESKGDTSVSIRESIMIAKNDVDLYQVLNAQISSRFLPDGRVATKTEDQLWVSRSQLRTTVESLNSPAFREGMLSIDSSAVDAKASMQSSYKDFKRTTMLFIRKLSRITVQHEANASVDKDAIIFGADDKCWSLDQLTLGSVVQTTMMFLGWLESAEVKQAATTPIHIVKNAFNELRGKVATTVNYKKQVIELKAALALTQEALKSTEGGLEVKAFANQKIIRANQLLSQALEISNVNSAEKQSTTTSVDEKKSEKFVSTQAEVLTLRQGAQELIEEASAAELAYINKVATQVEGQASAAEVKELSPTATTSAKQYYEATLSNSKPVAQGFSVKGFMDAYDNASSFIPKRLRSYQLRTTAVLRPTEKDIILHAMKNPYRYWGLMGNRTAKILYKEYGIDVSKIPSQDSVLNLTAAHANTYYETFKGICGEEKEKLEIFHQRYNKKLAAQCLPIRATHLEKNEKTLVRIIEETRSRSVFSYFAPFFFPSYNRSREVLKEMDVDLSAKDTSESLRNNLVKSGK